MRRYHPLRSIAIGLSLAILPAAHAARPASPKIAKPLMEEDVWAARAKLQTQVELRELAREPEAPGLALLVEHHQRLDDNRRSFVPIIKKGSHVLGVEYGRLYLDTGRGRTRSLPSPDELIKLGIHGKNTFERAVNNRIATVARRIKGGKGSDAEEKLRKDILASTDLMHAIETDSVIGKLREYQDDVRVAKGIARDERVILARGKAGSLVLSGYSVLWQDPGQTFLKPVTRALLRTVRVKTAEDFNRLTTARLVQLVGIEGGPSTADALGKALRASDVQRAEVAQLHDLLGAPHTNADLALVAQSRVLEKGMGAEPIVLAKGNGKRLEFQPVRGGGNAIVFVTDRGERRNARVADLHQFHIDSTNAFNTLASQVLAKEGK